MSRSSLEVVIDYTNHRGERAKRLIRPLEMYLGSTDHHPDEQWLLKARDVARDVTRDFAMKDIHGWEPAIVANKA